MRRIYFALLFLLVSVLVYGDPPFRHLGSMQGLSQSSAISIWQDALGRMWFGNDALNCYDGEQVRVFRISEYVKGVEDTSIRNLCGNDSVLYCLAEDQLICFDLKTEKIILAGIRTRSICNTPSGLFYVSKKVLYVYDWTEKKAKKIMDVEPKIDQVNVLTCDKAGLLWIGTSSGVYAIDVNNKKIVFEELKSISVLRILPDVDGSVWVAGKSHSFYHISANRHVQPVSLSYENGLEPMEGETYSMVKDCKGNIWIGCLNGSYQLTPDAEVKSQLKAKLQVMPESTIFALYSDRQGTLWFGSYYGDVCYFNPVIDNYSFYPSNEKEKTLLSGVVQGSITEDQTGTIYIATEGSGINIIVPHTDEIRHLTVKEGLPHNKIRSLWYDKESDRLYFGAFMKGLYYLDIKSKRITAIPVGALKSPYKLIVEDIIPYKDSLILLTQNGLFKMDLKTLKITCLFENKQMDELCSGIIRTIYVDDRDVLWVSSYKNGLLAIDLTKEVLKGSYGDGLKPESVIPSAVVSICGDSQRGLFFATMKSGVLRYQPQSDSFDRLTQEKLQLLSDICYNVDFAKNGDLVSTSNLGVTFLKMKQGQKWEHSSYLQLNPSFSMQGLSQDCGLFVSPGTGDIYIGGLYGLLKIPEEGLVERKQDCSIFFSSLRINNKPILPGSDLLPNNLYQTEKIYLPYNQNSIHLTFTTSDFLLHFHNQYEYKLEGLDKIWTKTEYKTITYNSLSPGKYTLYVRELQNPACVAKLTFIISPPFWQSWGAITLYIIAFVLLIWYILRFYKSRADLRTSLELEKREVQRIEESNRNKLEFFMNISNEFRTPLTLIINLLDRLSYDLPLSGKNKVERIYRQALRMQDLITELLDFRKMEQKMLHLRVRDYEMTEFLKDLYENFAEYAAEKKINYRLNLSGEDIRVWFDRVQLQKVFYNLLSLIFKNTDENESVQIRLHKRNNLACVEMVLSGCFKVKEVEDEVFCLINEELQKHELASLFDGGIGLAFSKGIIKLHKGSVAVRKENNQLIFSVQLPLGKTHFADEDLLTESVLPLLTDHLQETTELKNKLTDIQQEEDMIEKADKKFRMLLVGNSGDLCTLLKESFSLIYEVTEINSGTMGYEWAAKEVPDIILSEVNIQDMSGLDMCRMIKTNMRTLHIPVVLVATKPSSEQELESIRCGAVAYVVAPFNMEKLFLRCNSLVRLQKKIQAKFTGENLQQTGEMGTNEQDAEFLRAINQVLEDNLANGDFDSTEWSKAMKIGRTRLFNRMKSVTGLTPNEYIMNVKMDRSLLLLSNKDNTVAEVAYQLGFSNPAYFSKCFKNQFGITPQDYKKKSIG